ncbi:MAG: cell division protein ZapB [Desulfobacterales bacterium]
MDNEVIFSQFEDLEKKIENLIRTCRSLELNNSELKEKIERLEEELKGKIEAENNYHQERELIRSKVDNLLGKLADLDDD